MENETKKQKDLDLLNKMMQKKQKGIYSPEGWAHYKVTGEAAPEE